MKNTLYAVCAIAALSTTSAFAGAVSDPVLEAEIVIADTTASSSGGAAIVAMLALLLALPVLD